MDAAADWVWTGYSLKEHLAAMPSA